MTGRVYLVGAGPGDPELLTLKAVRVLASADVVLADDLVGDAVLDYARPGARVIHVGKRGGCQKPRARQVSTPQRFIERLMIAEARAGRQVVRLKGGDPFVFGRGGEECEALRDAGVPFEVVNGITAGIAAPAALGIPLTHRAACHGAIFVTGHAGADAPDTGPDWRALAATRLTLVIYMGVAQSDIIERELLAGGLAPATPVAAIQNATRPTQHQAVFTLHGMAESIRAQGLGSPCIIVVGETVRHAMPALEAMRALRAVVAR